MSFGSNAVPPVNCKFILGRMRERIAYQLGNVAIRDRIIFVLPLAPAGDESRVAKPSEALRYGRDLLAHRFGQVTNAGFLPAKDFH